MIIDKLVEATRIRLSREKENVTLKQMKEMVHKLPNVTNSSFQAALKTPSLSYILEVKKASPSKGEIVEGFPYIEIAKEYERIGASAISVLTEEDYFHGNIRYLKEIAETVNIPVLRKDFIIDEYMIYQAKLYGASAVLLITGILDDKTLKDYLDLTHELGMDALVEARDEEQVKRALKAGAKIIGINNRDLRDFSVDIHNSLRFRHLIPEDVIFVSESGIESREQTKELEDNNVQAVLIGETMMRADDKKKMMEMLKGED